MSALFIATPKVRHLAVWTADGSFTPTGRTRPICGTAATPGSEGVHLFDAHTVDHPDYLDPLWRRRFDAAMRRPICKRCAATLTALNDLNTRSTP